VKRPTLVVLSGMPGTGKSTLAAALAKRTKLPVFSVDPIESAIVSAKLPRSFETGLAAYLVAAALADARLELGQSAIVDAVNSVAYAKRLWRKVANGHRARLRIIECVCSSELLHRRRLARRQRELSERRGEWVAWTEPVLVVDGAEPLRRNVERALRWLR
jgi:predicted kinase